VRLVKKSESPILHFSPALPPSINPVPLALTHHSSLLTPHSSLLNLNSQPSTIIQLSFSMPSKTQDKYVVLDLSFFSLSFNSRSTSAIEQEKLDVEVLKGLLEIKALYKRLDSTVPEEIEKKIEKALEAIALTLR